MKFGFRRYRSAGVPVSSQLHALISRANRVRDDHDWVRAADLYRAVLAQRPDLIHLRIQLGHALKESGDLAGAETAYRDAWREAPRSRDARMQLGHILKLRDTPGEAAELFVDLAIEDPTDEEAMREARLVVGGLGPDRRTPLIDVLTRTMSTLLDRHGDENFPAIETCEQVYDASDLLSYFGHARRPTGIQRVQIETIVRALRATAAGGTRVGVCCFIEGRDDWVAIPPGAFLHIAELSLVGDGDAPEWHSARDRLLLWLLAAPSFAFARGAVLVNLGTSWWLQNYFLHVRDAQARYGIKYIPIIYDMIPVLFPDYCIEALVQDFIAWATGVFSHAAAFLAISEASKRDLIDVGNRIGRVISPESVTVIPLNAEFGTTENIAGEWPDVVGDHPFVLLVSTIEPRKGHLVAFDAWSMLLDQVGIERVPNLVCVGRNGWRNAAVYERLSADETLSAKVIFLANLSDQTLALLYDRSLFTIYPSLYEGWGLPVSESLCRGKAVITTTSSSLPEAGGSLAVYVAPGDPAALADEVQRLLADPRARADQEARIVREHHPYSWVQIAERIRDAVAALTEVGTSDEGELVAFPPVATLNHFHWIGRSYAVELREDGEAGEAFREGLGWYPPEQWGCRVRDEGGMLAWRLPKTVAPGSRLVVDLRLVGDERAPCAFQVGADGIATSGALGRREHRTVSLHLTVPRQRCLRLSVAGTTREQLHRAHDQDERDHIAGTVGVAGFFVRVHGDVDPYDQES